MRVELKGDGIERLPDLAERLGQGPSERSLGDVLSLAQRHLDDVGLIATTFALDGEVVPAAQLAAQARRPASDFEALRIDIQSTHSFLEATFEECSNSVARLRGVREEISEAARSGQIDAAFEHLSVFSEGLSVVLRAYRGGLTLLRSTGSADRAELQEAQERLELIEQVVADVLSGVTGRDAVLISDAFEYELPDQLEWLGGSFAAWRRRLEEMDVAESEGVR